MRLPISLINTSALHRATTCPTHIFLIGLTLPYKPTAGVVEKHLNPITGILAILRTCIVDQQPRRLSMQNDFDFDFTQLTDFEDTQTQGDRQETPSPAAVVPQPQKFSFKQSGGGRQWKPPAEPNAAAGAINKVQPVQPIAPQGFKPNAAAVNKWKPIVQREEESVERKSLL